MDVNSGIRAIRFVLNRFLVLSLVSTTVGIINKIINILAKKKLNLRSKDKLQLKCNCVNDSILDGVRQHILYSFLSIKPSGKKLFLQPETIHYKKINKSVLNTLLFYLENDNNEEVNFNGETLTFTLQKIKIQYIKCVFKTLKIIFFVLIKNTILVQKTCLVRQHIKKTGREIKTLVGKCVICNKKIYDCQ